MQKVLDLWAQKWFPFALLGVVAFFLYLLGYGDPLTPGRGTALIWGLVAMVAIYIGVPAVIRALTTARR